MRAVILASVACAILFSGTSAGAQMISDYFQTNSNWRQMDLSDADGYTGKGELIALCAQVGASRCYLRETKADVADLGRTEAHGEYRQRCVVKENSPILIRKLKIVAPGYFASIRSHRNMTVTSDISTCDAANVSDFVLATLTYDFSGGVSSQSKTIGAAMSSALFGKRNKSKFDALTGSFVFTREWMDGAAARYKSMCQSAYRNDLAQGSKIHEGLVIEAKVNIVQVQDFSGKLTWISKTDLTFPRDRCDPDLLAQKPES